MQKGDLSARREAARLYATKVVQGLLMSLAHVMHQKWWLYSVLKLGPNRPGDAASNSNRTCRR